MHPLPQIAYATNFFLKELHQTLTISLEEHGRT